MIAGNVLVDNSGVDLNLGNGYKTRWPPAQRILLPENNRITDNLVFKPSGGVAVDIASQDRAGPLAVFSFQPNDFEENRIVGGAIGAGMGDSKSGFAISAENGEAPPQPLSLPPTQVGPSWLKP